MGRQNHASEHSLDLHRQQRYDTIGALGNEHIRTPHIDRLVGEGTAFTQRLLPKPDLHS